MSVPLLAVVGHPNKGKSSIVATLAHDASVRIGAEPGTTTRTRRYPMRVDGRVLYELADTPGFQRARQVLAWMREHETDAARHIEVVRKFIDTHRDSGRFEDECELLGPIVEGAGILYVVDGSKPYGAEYEPEMEILRWTGRPRLAVVNVIGRADHVEEWRAALSQFFGAVRVFDAMTADFTRQVELLRAFGQLDETWTEHFDEAARALCRDRAQRHRLAAAAIAQMLVDMVGHVETASLEEGADLDAARERLERRYLDALRRREARGRAAVARVYDQGSLERREAAFEVLEQDLFAEESWSLWGLTRQQLLVTGAIGGAAAGAGVDLALGGLSLMAGSLLGAAAGTAAVWMGAERVAKVKVAGVLPLGGRQLTIGPSRSVNLPYVILGRALHHRRLVALRTHANREPLSIPAPTEPGAWISALGSDDRARLERILRKVRENGDGPGSADALGELLERIAEVP